MDNIESILKAEIDTLKKDHGTSELNLVLMITFRKGNERMEK